MARDSSSPWRLVLLVVAIAAAVGAALAIAVFVLVRDARLGDSLERARAEAVFDLRLAARIGEETDLQGFVASYEERGIRAVLLVGDRAYRSDPSLAVRIPSALRSIAARGELGYERVVVEGAPTLLVGGPTPGRDAELYFLFPERGIHDDLRELGTALAIGWVAIVAVAFALARVAAGRIATLAEAEAWGRRFTSDVSHELRTPVAALVSEAGVLEQYLDRMPAEARRAAELLVGDVARLRRLIEDLTNLASLDAGREQVHEEAAELAALVGGTIRSRGWDGRIELRADPVDVATDRSRVDRIVANLIGNAVEHGGARVAVRVGRDDRGPFVEVTDDGPGIAAEHLTFVFDRFYRGDPARAGPGSGLGLAIARENARLLGGDVEAWSEPGAGSRFTLRLPDDRAVAEPLREEGSRVAEEPDDGPRPRHGGGNR